MNDQMLIDLAKDAAQNAYAPYSGFSVGAALLTKDGKVYPGCNIENVSFGSTICAERTAFYKAISEGERQFDSIAIVGGQNGDFSSPCPPCGSCRQVMAEFCDPEFRIILSADPPIIFKLEELLPQSFHSL